MVKQSLIGPLVFEKFQVVVVVVGGGLCDFSVSQSPKSLSPFRL